MKIYFEDGPLYAKTSLELGCDHIINAACGYSNNEAAFENIIKANPNASVYTNSLAALINARKYCWNEETKLFELYIRINTDYMFAMIDMYTDRELRCYHNIEKLWLANVFEGCGPE